MANNKFNTDKVYGLSEEHLKSSIVRLAHFQPTMSTDKGDQIIDYLVLDALSSQGTLFNAKLDDIQSIIHKNIRLEFENQEILQSIRRLSLKKLITATNLDKSTDQIRVTISEHADHELSVKRNNLREIEDETITKWKKEILLKYESDNAVSENIDRIVASLQLFLSRMFLKHGIDSVAILYPDNAKTNNWIDSIEKQITQSLPSYNDYLDSIIKIEIPGFLRNNDANRKRYLTNLFNASFYWHLIHVDGEASKLLSSVTRGQRLILDNNILYNLVGIGGEEYLKSSHKLLKLAKELGYKLQITNKTLEEFQNSLKWQLKETKQKPPITAELARVAINNLGQENFLTAYWSGLAQKRLTIEEFVAEISYVHDILEGLDIEVFHKFQEDIEKSDELVDEMSKLKQACGDRFNEHVVEHDAFHRILIRKLRKRTRYNFKDAVAWFLTQDSKLPSYARFARKGQEYLPFCLTTNQWIQLNRPFISRTKDEAEYEESLLSLITQPFLRSLIPQHPLQEAYEKVLGRLSRYENMNSDLASEITSDMHFMLSIGKIAEEGTPEQLGKAVDDQLAKLNKELRKELEDLRKENKDHKEMANLKIQKLEEKIDLLGKSVESVSGDYQNLEQVKKDQQARHNSELQKLQKKRKADLDDWIEEFKETKVRKWQNAIWWNLTWLIPSVAFALYIIFTTPNIFNFTSTQITIIGTIVGSGTLFFLNLVRSRYWDEGNKKTKRENIKLSQELKTKMNEFQ